MLREWVGAGGLWEKPLREPGITAGREEILMLCVASLMLWVSPGCCSAGAGWGGHDLVLLSLCQVHYSAGCDRSQA